MIKIIFIASYDEMVEAARATFREILDAQYSNDPSAELFDFEILPAATTDELMNLQVDAADVIIVRGVGAYALQRKNFHIPVVELSISGSDMAAALLELQETYPNTPAGIIGSPNMLLGAEELAKRLNIDITPYVVLENSYSAICQQIDIAIKDGKRAILTMQRGSDYAKQKGLHCVLLRSGKHSLANSITLAMQIGAISRQNRLNAISNQALLDNAYEGLLSLDESNCIRAYNRAAQDILGIPPGAWCIGANISDILDAPSLVAFLSQENTIAEEIIACNHTQINFKKVAIFLRDEFVGNILTFLNASQIQESEEKLRSKMFPKTSCAKYSFSSIIGKSSILRKTISMANAYARTGSNIMVYGESGTGKELFVQSIHTASARNGHPFVAINCAAIPESLLESELFGYVGGAFTGASKSGKAGFFEQAHNGTVFLDEISEMPLSQQARLLRVLQEREITRLGSSKIIPVDIRIIAATNKNLQTLVSSGRFRQDLYYRLCVLTLHLPPLRERPEDIPLLIRHFLDLFGCGKPVEQEAQKLLMQHIWPGNVRELQNFCERLSVLSSGSTIKTDLVRQLLAYDGASSSPAPPATVSNMDRQIILEALQEANGNKSQAAQALGISRVTLWRRLKEMGYPS